MLLVVYTNISLRKLPLIIISKMFQILILKLLLNIAWADGNMRAWPRWWAGGWPLPPPTKCSQSNQRPRLVYIAILVTQGLSTSHVGQKVCVHAWPSRGVGGLRQIPPPKPSAVTTCCDTHKGGRDSKKKCRLKRYRCHIIWGKYR